MNSRTLTIPYSVRLPEVHGVYLPDALLIWDFIKMAADVLY